MKLFLRNLVAKCLGLLPLGLLSPLRHAYVKAQDGSLRKNCLFLLLSVVRYRQPDLSLTAFTLADDETLRLVNHDSVIARQLYWFGQYGWEGIEIDWWKHFCRQSQGILEIGANIGYYTVQGARAARNRPYIAVEPHPVSARILRENLGLNHIRHVRVVEAAVVPRKIQETVNLLIAEQDPDASPAGAYLLSETRASHYSTRQSITVPVIEAQDLVQGVDLIKIDAEGMEYDILSSIEGYIYTAKPILFLELLRRTSKLRRWLVDLNQIYGYEAFAFGRRKPHYIPVGHISEVSLEDIYQNRDVMLLPPCATSKI